MYKLLFCLKSADINSFHLVVCLRTKERLCSSPFRIKALTRSRNRSVLFSLLFTGVQPGFTQKHALTTPAAAEHTEPDQSEHHCSTKTCTTTHHVSMETKRCSCIQFTVSPI